MSLRRAQDPRQSKTHRRTGRLTEIAAVAVIAGAIVLGVIWIGAETVINRIATGDPNGPSGMDVQKTQTFHNLRGAIWKDTWMMIGDYPLIGAGLGAFATAYPAFRQDNGMTGVIAEAHNDYLQILADTGIVGGILLVWFIFVVGRSATRAIQARDPLLAGLALGGAGGMFGMLIHSLFDFNLHLPSHALLFLFLAVMLSHLAVVADENVPVHRASSPVTADLLSEVS